MTRLQENGILINNVGGGWGEGKTQLSHYTSYTFNLLKPTGYVIHPQVLTFHNCTF